MLLRIKALTTTFPVIGMELVSPIMFNPTSGSWEVFFVVVWCVFLLLYNPVVNGSCGTHIHVSPEADWTLDQAKQLSRGAIYYFHQLNALVPLERVMNQYCKGNRITSELIQSSVTEIFDRIGQAEDNAKLTALMCHGPIRKFAWNLCSLPEGTGIEFRLPPGSQGPEDTKTWIELTLSFVAACLIRDKWYPAVWPTMQEFKRFILEGAAAANIEDTSRLLGLFQTACYGEMKFCAGISGYCDALAAEWYIENTEEEIVVLGP